MATENETLLASLSDAQVDEILKSKTGKSLSELTKPPLTPEQIKEAEIKEREDALKWGLESKMITVAEYEEYTKANAGDKVSVAREKFKRMFPDLKDADKAFNELTRQDEDDEIEDGETMVPNTYKQIGTDFAKKLADEEMDTRFKKIKDLPETFRTAKEKGAITQSNVTLIEKTVVPKRLETSFAGEPFGIDISDDDIGEAKAEAIKYAAGKKGLTQEEITTNITNYLTIKNNARLIQEGIRVCAAKEIDLNKRGQKGLLETATEIGTGAISPKRAALIRQGILPVTAANTS